MEKTGTVLFPRSLPINIAPNQPVTVVGQISRLNEQAKTLYL